jgi:hypothetical protein
MSVKLPIADSAVCAMEMPSFALRTATVIPLICDVILLPIASPAASSFAEFTRKPEDKRSIEVDSELEETLRFLWALRELILVLIDIDMMLSSDFPDFLTRKIRVVD